DDDFLTNVAPLRQTDRTVLDAGFERNGAFAHVLRPGWASRFDAGDLGCVATDANRARSFEGVDQRTRCRLLHHDVEAVDAQIVAPNDRGGTSRRRQLAIAEERQRGKRLVTLEGLFDDRRGLRTVDAD